MDGYKVLKNETMKIKGIDKKYLIIKRKQNKPFDVDDVKTITSMIEERFIKDKKKEPKILVRGLGIQGIRTLKSYEMEIDDMFDDDEDYLRGRVKDSTKFMKFTELEITMYS